MSRQPPNNFMARITRPIHRYQRWQSQASVLAVGICICFGLLLLLHQNLKGGSGTTMKPESDLVTIETGTVLYSVYGETRKVPYYHCASNFPPDQSYHLVLLHGARFTKEDWKSSGIVDSLCRNPQVSVSAMDLSIKAGHRDIAGMLSAMREEVQISLPVTLITPSASGMSIVDWMSTGRLPDLPKYVEKWIPVACFAVSAATEDQLARMSRLENFEVLAIFGSKDRGGKDVSTMLEDHVGARSLELQGGHACYLDSPLEFCTAVLKFLGLRLG